jgi:hypothetical protein
MAASVFTMVLRFMSLSGNEFHDRNHNVYIDNPEVPSQISRRK